MRYLLDAIYLVALPFVLFANRKRRSDLWPRFLGRTGIRKPEARNRTVWFHGVSVGEIHLLRSVISQFRARQPEFHVVVSATTDAGFSEAERCFPNLRVIRWPLDFSWAVDRALRDVRPELIVLAESDWWPNFLLAAKRLGVPVAAINVRMSPRSLARYRVFRTLARRWLALVSHFAVQTRDYASNLAELGIPEKRITVTGSVKYDGAQSDRSNPKTAQLRTLLNIDPNDRVWIAGSTQAPEEKIVLAIYVRLRSEHPKLRLILVPRHAERFAEVADLLVQSGLSFVRRSRVGPSDSPSPTDVVLIDTMGELGAAWGLADIAFVGGSLDGSRGGQNMIEPAAYGAAVLFGPHTWNFRDTVRRFLDADSALEVQNETSLETAMQRLLADPELRRRLGDNARQMVHQQQGATNRTLEAIDRFLPRRGRRHAVHFLSPNGQEISAEPLAKG